MDAAMLELAEEPGLWIGPDPTSVTVATAGYSVVTWGRRASVQRLRLEGMDVARALDEVRAIGQAHDVTEMTWWVGELTTPHNLGDRLRDLGLVPDAEVPTLTSLTIDHKPAGTPAIDVRRVESYDDFIRALELDWEVWGLPEEIRAARRANGLRHWQLLSADGDTGHYLAFVDDEPVGFGRAVFTPAAAVLLGGATLPAARGHGVYTALVHARWDEAVERGTPRLAVSGGAMSAPILERLGFRRIGSIELLVDRL
jgi:GNAT superfamily N-acetyltransferase